MTPTWSEMVSSFLCTQSRNVVVCIGKPLTHCRKYIFIVPLGLKSGVESPSQSLPCLLHDMPSSLLITCNATCQHTPLPELLMGILITLPLPPLVSLIPSLAMIPFVS